MSDLLAKLKAGSLNSKDIPWPGNEDLLIRMRVYNDNDHLKATLATDKVITNVTMSNVERYNAELYTQLLYLVITDLDNKPIGTIADFRTLLTPEIKKILIDLLDALHEECSPDPENMTSEEFDLLLNDIKKNVEETVLSVSNIFTLRKLVLSLVLNQKK